MTAAELWRLDRRALRRVADGGHPFDPRALDDREYRGVSLGLPRLVERLSWKKFKKAFHRDPATGELRGWNVRVVDNALAEPWEPLLRHGAPVTFGHFVVDGSLLDYGRGRNGRLSPLALVRDPLVAVNAGSSALLLGWTYLDVAGLRIGTPSYFTLELDGPLTHRA